MIVSAFSASLILRFSLTTTFTFFPGSPAPETHLPVLRLPDSDLGPAREEGLIPAIIIVALEESCSLILSFFPSTTGALSAKYFYWLIYPSSSSYDMLQSHGTLV
ncbi:hypothetical protein CsSME_00027185 [Camellia sinensis var. sinensis]